ncbi:hypothetical protein H696_04054 [Fonticula alba]|uniref:Translation initiation factor eIF2B subunit beta n=1 Tax=Fonticula alba TaxID=691883 RepID=A0A058Z7Y5_FONAL|nr:hypothetical protein H696_04054 [Fonticula alba]KCV69637.1 hypothetical protein H696_04054 [Fonticula alba]|eukprot:XP_009496202.1 hypothetical protein H696_04054 [Fonticula alba]
MERPSHSMFTLLDDGSASLPPSQAVSRRSSFDGAEQLSLDKQKRHHAIASMAHEIVDGIINDLTDTQKNISRQALQHIHMNEVLMTYGASPTCEAFFLEAARKRTFQVLIADSTFSAESQETAKRLSEKDINTTLVYDTSIFALMARVNKVVISAHAVLANGGIIAQAGTNLLLQAAHHYSTPVVVLAGLYNLSPLYSFHPQIQNILLNASDVANYEDDLHPDVQNLNPQFDYVPPEMINLFVTNDGDHSPSYVYRLLAEQYDFQDYSL